MTDEEEPRMLIDPFVAELMTASMKQTQSITNQVMDNYKQQILELQADYVKLWDAVNRAGAVITTRALEGTLANTEWKRDRAVQALRSADPDYRTLDEARFDAYDHEDWKDER